MLKGTIVKGIGGFYYIAVNNENVYECRARGKFRLDNITPTVGDDVEFEEENGKGYLQEILPRKSLLIRPAVANVEQLVLVLSAYKPKPDFLLIDKLIIQASINRLDALLCLNKMDCGDSQIIGQIQSDYLDTGLKINYTSAKTGEGLPTLKEQLKGKLSCFAGQSAVGKSSILNALCAHFELETGEISKKSGRGKHTTRASELLSLYGEGFVLDTPGFSMFELEGMEAEELRLHYREFAPFEGKCRFENCIHLNEPECAVKVALNDGAISKARFERYLIILKELQEKRRKKYD